SSATSSVRKLSPPHGGNLDYSTTCDQGALVQLYVGLLNNRSERFALLAGEVCKGLAGKARELGWKGVEGFAYIQLLADGIQFRGQLVDNDLRHVDRSNPSEPGLHLDDQVFVPYSPRNASSPSLRHSSRLSNTEV